MPFNKSEYDMQYAKEHVTRRYLCFNKDDPEDQELLIWLQGKGKGNMNAYIKQLIKDDLEYQKGVNLAEKRRIRCQNGSQNREA